MGYYIFLASENVDNWILMTDGCRGLPLKHDCVRSKSWIGHAGEIAKWQNSRLCDLV